MKKTVAIVFGGKSSEYLVSLSSTSSVLQNFPYDRYNCLTVGMSEQGQFYMGEFTVEELENNTWLNNPTATKVAIQLGGDSCFVEVDSQKTVHVDVAFNMIHGKYGEDGILQALFKSGNMQYTGCDGQSSILAYDKDITHRLLDQENITKAKYRTLTHEITETEYNELAKELGGKVILKPAREGSSYGISMANDYETFAKGLKEALQFDDKIVVEQVIVGFEVGASVLEKDGQIIVGEIDEIELFTDFFDYEAKYAFKDARIVCPARISEDVKQIIKNNAIHVFKQLGCRDFSRVDFFYGNDGVVYFNEINTIPGFTSHSRFPNMMKGIGIEYPEIISTLIENALRRL